MLVVEDTKGATAMKTTKKPARSCRIYPGSPALLTITEGTRSDDYFLEGLGLPGTFRFRKPLPDGTTYDVDLAAGSCDCPGRLRWEHKTVCKHRAALAALIAVGKLVA
jgi:hypothetical protein